MIKYQPKLTKIYPLHGVCTSQGKKQKIKYYKNFATFDTETSNNHDVNNLETWVYLWGIYYNNDFYYGECIETLINFIDTLNNVLDNTIIIFVHNLAYDFSYINKYLGKPDDALYLSTHKPLYVRYNKIELRCSYLLTQMSLDKFTKNENVENKKLTGSIDYTEVHYPNECFSSNNIQLQYLYNDVVGLYQALISKMYKDDDNLSSIPFTSTGYIRRILYNEYCKDYQNNRKIFDKCKMNYKEFILLNTIFKGGYTHCNNKYVNKHCKGNIKHRDFTSHYPTQLLINKYPIEHFREIKGVKLNQLTKLNIKYSILLEIQITNAKCKNGLPYLSLMDCLNDKQSFLIIQKDNGRINKIKGVFNLKLTFEDLQILAKTYLFTSLKIIKCYVAKKDYLPKYFVDTVLKAFVDKTINKNKVETIKDKNSVEYINALQTLQLSKFILNGLYGLCATSPIRDKINFLGSNEFELINKKHFTSNELQELLDKYNQRKKSFLPYQWGVFVTVYARVQLFKAFEIIGFNNVIYCDTDSAFYYSNHEIEQRLTNWNNELKKQAIEHNAYCELNGQLETLNQFSDEHENITDFKSLHAKCYLYTELINGKEQHHTTIAGVKKAKILTNKLGVQKVHYSHIELGYSKEQKYKNFKHGFTFKIFGGTSIKYTENGGVILNVDKTLSQNELIETRVSIDKLQYHQTTIMN